MWRLPHPPVLAATQPRSYFFFLPIAFLFFFFGGPSRREGAWMRLASRSGGARAAFVGVGSTPHAPTPPTFDRAVFDLNTLLLGGVHIVVAEGRGGGGREGE